MRQEWYAGNLAAAGEPSFRALARRPGRTWRFLYLRNWHHAVVIRVSKVGERGVAEVHVLSGDAVPGHVGRPLEAWRVSLSEEEVAGLEEEIARVGLFSLPSRDPDPLPDFDGARWVFEGLDDGLHVVVDRFSPEDPALTRLGHRFLELGRVHVPERELY